MKAKILIADDEKEIRDIVKMLLEGEGYEVVAAKDGQEALDLADSTVDLYILDVNMPVLSGFAAAAKIRKRFYAPILFLTAYSGESDKVMGFSVGGDDYLVKPFSFQELEARITALLRRSKEKRTSELVCGDLILDCNTRRARRGDHEMELTVKEYRLLEHFMNNQGVVLSRVNLLKHVWDKNFDTNTNVVDVYVNYLRTKIDKDYENKLIHTVVGLGYIMESH